MKCSLTMLWWHPKNWKLTLTGKSCGLEERAPMCGIPYHAVEDISGQTGQHGAIK